MPGQLPQPQRERMAEVLLLCSDVIVSPARAASGPEPSKLISLEVALRNERERRQRPCAAED